MFKLSKRSLDKLEGVNPLLINVVKRAIELSEVDFGISEGVRSLERQKQLLIEKKSLTLKSKHLTGDAVDVYAWVDGYINWNYHYYEKIAEAMFSAAKELNVEIRWGGNFKQLKDGVHFELKGDNK